MSTDTELTTETKPETVATESTETKSPRVLDSATGGIVAILMGISYILIGQAYLERGVGRLSDALKH